MTTGHTPTEPSDFIRDIVAADLSSGRYRRIVTRFPPEPNGYLHIGHAKSICLNFGIAREFGGQCNLRMDDTNPTKEETEYVESIIDDVHWLVDGWADQVLPADVYYASGYFEGLYDHATRLIRKGKAYVCDLTADQMIEYRGAPDKVGRPSPFRERPVDENLYLFRRMRAGDFPDGARTLRAKIDMASPNIHLRDPALYRIRHATHHRTGDAWCIYPMYDYAHCLSDYVEGITHSICTLEFEVHRPLYDWILDQLVSEPRPHQYEFARLNLSYTIMSKRKLFELVQDKLVAGWDDPRMPTIAGLRRRGITPEAIRDFSHAVGVTKYNGLTDVAVLEHAVRTDLNQRALRRLAVLRPLKVVITNYPPDRIEELDAVNHPEDPAKGSRRIPFSNVLYIERDDFHETPPPKFFRLRPGGEVRLKYAYIIRCEEAVKDASGVVTELRCTADLDSKSGGATSNRKVKGTIQWVSAPHAVEVEARLYDRLFTVPQPEADGGDFKRFINGDSLEVVLGKGEPSLAEAQPSLRYQFERVGYFCLDPHEHKAGRAVFNRTIGLKDTWAKSAPGPEGGR